MPSCLYYTRLLLKHLQHLSAPLLGDKMADMGLENHLLASQEDQYIRQKGSSSNNGVSSLSAPQPGREKDPVLP